MRAAWNVSTPSSTYHPGIFVHSVCTPNLNKPCIFVSGGQAKECRREMSRIEEKVSAQRRLIAAGNETGDSNRSKEEDADEAQLDKLRHRQVFAPVPPRGRLMHLCCPPPNIHTLIDCTGEEPMAYAPRGKPSAPRTSVDTVVGSAARMGCIGRSLCLPPVAGPMRRGTNPNPSPLMPLLPSL